MANSYAREQPKDRFGEQVKSEQASAVAPAYATNTSGANVSSIIALDGRSTILEVVTGNGVAGLKWFGSVMGSANINPSVTTTNFDNAIPANFIRRFVIPQSVTGVGGIGSVVGGEGAKNGLYTQVAVIPLSGTGSIFTAQF